MRVWLRLRVQPVLPNVCLHQSQPKTCHNRASGPYLWILKIEQQKQHVCVKQLSYKGTLQRARPHSSFSQLKLNLLVKVFSTQPAGRD